MVGEPQSGGRKGVVSGALGIGGFLLASVLGRWAGLAALLPLGVAAASYYFLKRVMPPGHPSAAQLAAVQVGHVAWFLLALFIPGGLAQVGLDIVVLGGLLIWFGFTLSRKAAYVMLAVQSLSVLANLATVSSALEAGTLPLLCVHILLRVAAIYLVASFLIHTRRTKATTQAEVFE